jgi:hypothetical protein
MISVLLNPQVLNLDGAICGFEKNKKNLVEQPDGEFSQDNIKQTGDYTGKNKRIFLWVWLIFRALVRYLSC